MIRKILVCWAAFSCVCGLVWAEKQSFAHDKSDIASDAQITWGVLGNGIRYAIMPNEEPPDRVSLRLYVDAGSLMETESQQGLAHFLEHMAFNGTTHFKPGELVEYFQRIGMAFGADNNAHTGFKETVYKLELPENTDDFLLEGFRVLRDYADGMLLLDSEIERERGVILSEKRSRDSVGYRTFVANWKFLFPESMIPKRLPIGTEEVIKNAPRKEFVDFYKSWYTTERMAVIVVGAVEPEKIKPLIKKHFGSMVPSESPKPDPDLGEISSPGIAAHLHSEPEATTTTIEIMSIRPYEDKPDNQATRIEDTLAAAANRIVTRRLEKLAKEEGAPFSKAVVYAYDYLKFFELGGVDIDCQPEQWKDALGVAEQALRKAKEFGFTQAEIDEVKANLLNDAEEAVKQAPSRKSRSLSSAIVRSVSRDYVFTSPETDLEITKAALAKLTPETALKAFRALWSDEDRFLFVSGNLELEDSEASIKAAFAESQKVEVTPPVEEESKAFAYTSFGEPTDIVEERYDEELEVHQLTFGNNVRLNIKKTDFQANSVLVGARFGGGKLTLSKEQAGLDLLASSIFTQGGLEEHSADELERILAGKSVGVSFSAGDDAFTLMGQTNPDDFLLQLQLMAAYLTAPGYRAEAERLARQNFEKLYVQIEHTLEGVIRNEVSQYLASGDHRFGYPDKEMLLKRTTAEVKAWLDKALKESYLEVSVVGDIDPEVVKTAMAKTFGALPERAAEKPAYQDARVIAFPSDASSRTFSFETKIPRAASIVYWPTTDIWDIGNTRRLNMLSDVFDDRLRVQIREAIGEAYSPYSISRPDEVYDDYGLFYSFAVADPDKAEKIGKIVLEIGEQLKNDGVTQDELDRMLAPKINQLEEYVRNNNYWLQRVLMKSQEKPVTLEWARSMITDYKSITVEDLNKLAKEYLSKERGLKVQVLPKS